MVYVRHAERVQCACGSIEFDEIRGLTRHPGQGITSKVVGHRCSDCKQRMDLDRENRVAELKRKQAELKEIEEELSELHKEQWEHHESSDC